jgi:hypothetical protein
MVRETMVRRQEAVNALIPHLISNRLAKKASCRTRVNRHT